MATAAKVGGGLVEISAVATIIGAPTAEMLIHGLKGACGVAWAPMSAFGAIHITKACLAAATPNFLREASGLRNIHVDDALGIAVPVNARKRAKNRVDLGDASAIQVVSKKPARTAGWRFHIGGTRRSPSLTTSTTSLSWWSRRNKEESTLVAARSSCVYVLDKNTRLALDTVYPTQIQNGEAMKIHRFEPDFAGVAPAWKDWVVLMLSSVKVLEAIALWKLGATTLWFWTCMGWSHAFVSAVILQLCGLGRDSLLRAPVDIVAGDLPSPLHLGGSGKIILQVPSNVRKHFLWKVFHGTGIFFNAAGLLGTFLFLGKESPAVIYTWVGFQVMWLLSRTFVHYFVEGAAAARQGVMLRLTWEEVDDEDRWRVLNLLESLSKHQVSIHPRGVLAYRQDCLAFAQLTSQLEDAGWCLTMKFPGSETNLSSRKIQVKAVSGDTIIRSVVWFTGSVLENSELYDATVAFVQVQTETLAIPCVRVWACDCLPAPDSSRGNAHPDCGMIKWLYFIPFSSSDRNGWLMAYGQEAVGLLMTEILSSHELDNRFRNGRYRISMQSIEDLEHALEVARNGVVITRDLLKSATEDRRQPLQGTTSKLSATTAVEVSGFPI